MPSANDIVLPGALDQYEPASESGFSRNLSRVPKQQSDRRTVHTAREHARLKLLREAVALRPNSPELLYALADMLAECGAYDEYAQVFRRAVAANPCALPDLVCKVGSSRREAALSLRARTAALMERDVLYSQVLVAHAIAEAALGNAEQVEYLMDYDAFFRCETIEPSYGLDRAQFHLGLIDEIKSGLTYFGRKEGAAMNDAWWYPNLLRPERPAAWQLRAIILSRVKRYIAELPAGSAHPFVRSAPGAFKISGWALVSHRDSFHEPHFHPDSWLSGIYYVASPRASRHGGKVGWLRLGPRASLKLSPADGWQERFIPPEPGTLVLMPGYFVHQTEPMGVDEERICIAFDIMPTQFPRASATRN